MQYVLVGNYGTGNLGDEALKEYFLKKYPHISWKVISAKPSSAEFPRLPCGLRSVFSAWWRTVSVLKHSDGIVFGGGSLFTDTESVRACLIWWWHAFWARVFGRKIILAFQGIGPFTTKMGEWCARYAVRRAAFISVRDALSFERIKGWQKNTEVVQTCDPVISLIKAKIQSTDTKNVLAIIPRGNSTGTFTAKALEEVHSKNWNRIIIISMQGSDRSENKYCLSLAKLSEGRIMKVKTMDELVSAVGCASKVISQRYHGALTAKIMRKDLVAVSQSDSDKLETIGNIDLDKTGHLLLAGEAGLEKALSA